jgi:hypothetical protein
VKRSNLGLLTLIRLLPPGEKGETREKVSKDLTPLAQGRSDSAAWARRLEGELAELEGAGLIATVRKGKTFRLTLTDQGRQTALRHLGLDELPPKTTWAKLKSTYVLALALGHDSPSAADVKRISAAAGLKAELLRSHYELPLDEKATIKQATDALSSKLIGLEPTDPFTMDRLVAELLRREGILLRAGQKPTLKAIQEALLRRELGEPDAKDPVTRLVARNIDARQANPAGLGEAAVRRWIGSSEESPTPPDVTPLEEFARRVHNAARGSSTGWFGEGKVFIGHVWRALRFDDAVRGINFDEFKGRLIEAHNARLIELGRGDLVDAMDPADVRESATPFLNAVYHFVRVGEEDR